MLLLELESNSPVNNNVYNNKAIETVFNEINLLRIIYLYSGESNFFVIDKHMYVLQEKVNNVLQIKFHSINKIL